MRTKLNLTEFQIYDKIKNPKPSDLNISKHENGHASYTHQNVRVINI